MLIVVPTKEGINQAVAVLRKGGVVVYPTDTAYALGGKFNSPLVIPRILRIKNRRGTKFTMIASSLHQVQHFFTLSNKAKELAKKHWPGPLSLVVSPTFSVRVPKNKVAQTLARRLGAPLIATSANRSGHQTPYHGRDVIKAFKGKKNQPDLVIDAGRLPRVAPSTIVKVAGDQVTMLRSGPIKI